MTYQKGGSYYEDMGSSQETEDRIELDLERARSNKYKFSSIPSSLLFLLLCPTCFLLVILLLLTHLVEFTFHEDELYKIESQPQGDFNAYLLISSVRCSSSSGHYSSFPACSVWGKDLTSSLAAAAKSLQSCPTLCGKLSWLQSTSGFPVPGRWLVHGKTSA